MRFSGKVAIVTGAGGGLGAEYAAADVLAFPTLADGFGLVIQEAMCTGTPVLTTRCGGGPACITDGQNGWIVTERRVDEIAERLQAISRDRDEAWAMGRRARARAEMWTPVETRNAIAIELGRALGGDGATGSRGVMR